MRVTQEDIWILRTSCWVLNGNIHVGVTSELLDLEYDVLFCSEHIVPVTFLLEGVYKDLRR